MRISDWSSDVCSSDLAATRIGPTAAPTRPAVALKNAMPVPRKLPGATRFNAALAHAMNGDSTVRNRPTNARNSHARLEVNASEPSAAEAGNANAYNRHRAPRRPRRYTESTASPATSKPTPRTGAATWKANG